MPKHPPRHNWTVVVNGRRHSFELYSNANKFAGQLARAGGYAVTIEIGPENKVMRDVRTQGAFKVLRPA